MTSFDAYVYDIESYPNCFTCVIKHIETGQRFVYEISEFFDQTNAFRNMLNLLIAAPNIRMVGYNNLGYDYPVLHDFINDPNATFQTINAKSQAIIKSKEQFEHTVPEWKILIPQLDLLKIHHFDNAARRTSLKQLEFVMRSDDVTDLPYDPTKNLTPDQIRLLIDYNSHDVDQTEKFYHLTEPKISFREQLNTEWLNYSDTKLGVSFFQDRLSYLDKHAKTYRSKIDIGSILLPYIQFTTPEFNAIKDWFSRQVITETKGTFTEIPFDKVQGLLPYCDQTPKNKKLKVLNVIHDDLKYVFGLGGIHASREKFDVSECDDYCILDVDVTSYYPSIGIVNGMKPEHMSDEFTNVYKSIKQERTQIPKSDPRNGALKLALNSVYGKTNSHYSPFYDPQYTMKTTINGQLLLCMLAEKLNVISKIIQVNTDGLTIHIKRSLLDQAKQICADWEAMTKLDLEYANYSRMYIRDVNNYIAVYDDGKMKRKGCYEYENLDYNKNHSNLISKKAAVSHILHGTDIKDYILNHTDHHDFTLFLKIPRSSYLELEDGERLNNAIRYYVSTKGQPLFKRMPPLAKSDNTEYRKLSVEKGWKVTECCNIGNFDWSSVDYSYYITEAKKLVF